MSLTTTTIKPTRAELCRMILTKNKGDLEASTAELVTLAQSDAELQRDLIQSAARHMLTHTAGKDRENAFDNSGPFTMNAGAKAAQDRARSAAATVSGLLLDMPIPIEGVLRPLRECLGTDISTYADGEIGKAKTLLRRANFLKAIGATAGARKIGQVFNEDGLRKLYDKEEKRAA